jgi:hypothetical protein
LSGLRHDLLVHVKEQGFRASGTIRENRTKKCPLSPGNIMKKKERGYFEFSFDKKMTFLSQSGMKISVFYWQQISTLCILQFKY